MEDVIRKIIEIDHLAEKLDSENADLRRETEVSVENDKKAVRERYLERARGRIWKNAALEEKFLEQALREIAEKQEEVAARLNGIYESMHLQWAEEIYNRVLGR